jgi:hypothetical protein
MEKPATKGSALLQVLKRSLAVKVGLSETYVWGEAPETQSLRAAYATLVQVHAEIGGLIQDDWAELLPRFETLTKLMQGWESKDKEVANNPEARGKREAEIIEQTKTARELLQSVKGEPERLRKASQTQAKQYQDDVDLVANRLKDLRELRNKDIGDRTPPKMDGFEKVLLDFERTLQQTGKPLSIGQRDNSIEKAFKDIKDRIDTLVAEVKAERELLTKAEDKRKKDLDEQLKAKQLADAKQLAAKQLADEEQRKRDDWRIALLDAQGKAEAWRKARDDDNPVKRGIAIDAEAFKPLLKTLQTAISEIRGLVVGKVGDLVALQQSVASLDKAGEAIERKANDLGASVPANLVLAVDTLTDTVLKRGEPLGTKPMVAEAKKAAALHGIPGLHDQVIEAYSLRHAGTPPQIKLQDQRRSALQGEADKWLRIGPWMHEVGMGGAPMTGPNGPVYMVQTRRIDGKPSHFSQFDANAEVPPKGLKSTVDEAMKALFADAVGRFGPHLTLELSPKYGSPDNARLFKGSGAFASGAIPVSDETVKAMQKELDNTVAQIRMRLTMLLGA